MKMGIDFHTCVICEQIPEHMFVETLHTDERLPEEVARLEVIGGYGFYGYPQARKCPLCRTYYRFLHDHDSEAGVGYGWTDEEIERLTPEAALKLMEKILEDSRGSLKQARQMYSETQDVYEQEAVERHTQEAARLVEEISYLKKLLGGGE